MRRIRRAMKRTTAAVVVFAIALGLFASLPPSTLRDIEDSLHRIPRVLENAVRPTAERVPERLREPTSARRNSNGSGHRRVTVSGAARVIDGDTMDVRGTRIRLFGIRRAGAGADLPGREPALGVRPAGDPSAPRSHRQSLRSLRRARPRTAHRRGLPGRHGRAQPVDGARRLGTRLPQVLPFVRGRGVARACSEARRMAERVRPALGLASRQAARGCRAGRAARQGRVPHQGKYQHEWKAHLPRSGRTALRKGPHRHPKGRKVVLLRVGGKARRVATVTRVAPGRG